MIRAEESGDATYLLEYICETYCCLKFALERGSGLSPDTHAREDLNKFSNRRKVWRPAVSI